MATYIALNAVSASALVPFLQTGDTILLEPGIGLTSIVLNGLSKRGIKTQARALCEFQDWSKENPDVEIEMRIEKHRSLIANSVLVLPIR